MNPIVEHFVSGQAFFTGNILIIIGVIFSLFEKAKTPAGDKEKTEDSEEDQGRPRRWTRQKLLKLTTRLLIIIGVIFVIASSTPVSRTFFHFFGLMLLTLFASLQFASRSVSLFNQCLRVIIVGCCIYAMRTEYYYSQPPLPPPKSYDKMFVFGDSLSAGIGLKGEETWTELLAKQHDIEVVKYAIGGATASTHLETATELQASNAVILLEIGGNDILRKTPVPEFERDLRKLLQALAKPNRVLVMIELPSPPFSTGYCLVQRDLARRFGAYLIPKRELAGILSVTANNASADDFIHLSQHGQQAMAELVWRYVSQCFAPKQADESTKK